MLAAIDGDNGAGDALGPVTDQKSRQGTDIIDIGQLMFRCRCGRD